MNIKLYIAKGNRVHKFDTASAMEDFILKNIASLKCHIIVLKDETGKVIGTISVESYLKLDKDAKSSL